MARISISVLFSFFLLSLCDLTLSQEFIWEQAQQSYNITDESLSEEIPVSIINIYDNPKSGENGFLNYIDSLRENGTVFYGTREKPVIFFSEEQALEYLRDKISPDYWRDDNDPLRKNIERLIFYVSQPPFDTIEYYLTSYPYDSLEIPYILKDTLSRIVPVEGYPFRFSTSPFQNDSLAMAISTLLNVAGDRDSTAIKITGNNTNDVLVWLNSNSGSSTRYWLKSDADDSVTVWISSPSRKTLILTLEHGVNIRRPILQSGYSEATIERERIDNSTLLEINNVQVKKQFWKTHADASFALNQTGMTNWVSGGENTIAVTTELVGNADYENKLKNVISNNFVRLKYGLLTSQEYGFRKNIDLLETSSKVNTKAFGKFDFSGYLLIKTTIAKGYKYPNDSVAVSKFMNPGTFTIGIGLDYKPNKNLSINFSPFSYKVTFVTDTLNIDQTLYGLNADKKSKHEPGVSLQVNHLWDMTKQIKVVNKLQLFTNYIDKPQNVDIDWEMTLTAKLNWFTDFKLNTHLIFDDNTKSLEYDKNDNPVLWPDGTQKKNSRVQFKEIIGFSFVFMF